MNKTRLDVGCGSYPSGDVNCELFITDIGHRNEKGRVLNVHKIKNFVLCDAQHLSFKSNYFDEVFCSHVIEHVKNPIKCLNELVRVSKCDIEIITPHWLGDKFSSFGTNKFKFHKSLFRCKWFHTYCVKYNLFCKTRITRTLGGVLGLFLKIPFEITIYIRKLEK